MSDYKLIVKQVKARHAVRVRKWRRNMSGCAWQVRYEDGRVIRWVEAPFPKTVLSLGIFLHEVGHHVIGFDHYKQRCEEEYHVWKWALAEMRRLGIKPDEKVLKRFHLSMEYAVGKALRRGIKKLPESLSQFLPKAA
ncbi:MAG: hypothetical protein JWP03_4282 [Phycisphaerales bacterium]|jgi:hypothetical protein|nr:hypothetical protein [Phycisphaerales bacterium]